MSIGSSNIFKFKSLTQKSYHVTVLGALKNEEHVKILNSTGNYSKQNLHISSRSFILNSNPLLTVLKLCEIGDRLNAKVIIACHTADSNNDLILSAISYVSDYYHIPVITIGSRENIFSDKVN